MSTNDVIVTLTIRQSWTECGGPVRISKQMDVLILACINILTLSYIKVSIIFMSTFSQRYTNKQTKKIRLQKQKMNDFAIEGKKELINH